MAQSLRSEGKSGEDLARWIQGAATAVRAAKDQVLAKALALQVFPTPVGMNSGLTSCP